MKFLADPRNAHSITGYGPNWIEINRERFDASIIVSVMGHRSAWNCSSFEALETQHFEQLLDLGAELVLFGSGPRLRLPRPQWQELLYAQRIGLETMDTQAACRAYNFLAAEGRKVAAALLL